MEQTILKIRELLKTREGKEPQTLVYSIADKKLFCIPDHYPGTGQFKSDVINDIYYSEYLANLCGGNIEDVYASEITYSNRFTSKKVYYILTDRKEVAKYIVEEHLWDWIIR